MAGGSFRPPEPEEVQHSHPKERRLKQHLGLEPPDDEETLELPKHQKFPQSLPSKHPKEKALEQQLAQGATVNPLPQSLVDKVPSKTRIDKGSFPNPSRIIGADYRFGFNRRYRRRHFIRRATLQQYRRLLAYRIYVRPSERYRCHHQRRLVI